MKHLSPSPNIDPLIAARPEMAGKRWLQPCELQDLPLDQVSNRLTKIGIVSASQYLAPHTWRAPIWPGFLRGQAEQPVRVLLIEDDPQMSRVITNELLADLRINLLGQGSTVRQGRRLISKNEFDVLLVDLNLGDGTGFELIEYMKKMRPTAEAVVISALADEDDALHAFELGATGYLVKNSWFGNFPHAVLQVVNGGASITPSVARRLLSKFVPSDGGHASHVSHENERKAKLSEREKHVLHLVASGHTSPEIGLRLCISGHTVNTHIKNIYNKLNVRTRAQAVSFATSRGLFR